MKLSSFYPVICTDRVHDLRDFYTTYFAFEVIFDAGWYVSLRRPGDPAFELGLLSQDHETIPERFRHGVSGLLLNFEVEDVDAEYERLVGQHGLSPVAPLRSEEFGQRHFILEDPAGVLIDVITEIPPTGAFA
ncbi:MAG: glyoxalase/bleomycin resistance/extradiol dioxygenase family protein [Sphaerobacteraceae bacterium]|nr:MAG: glyoxalase/bleomycin resistance/extradiol dioxygenase family protein [Sphaerobacteraceae bacterium]